MRTARGAAICVIEGNQATSNDAERIPVIGAIITHPEVSCMVAFSPGLEIPATAQRKLRNKLGAALEAQSL
jgi:hypothetical protein